ncbi:MAG: crotonase/enoyl-CoA hydratase family protein [Candidatus Nanopelagicales bacterium]
MNSTVVTSSDGPVTVVTIDRPERRNAVDRATATALYDAFVRFDDDPRASVAVLTGAGGTFCAGADLRAIADGVPNEVTTPPAADIVGTPAPMGPTRLVLGKPVIAAIEGHAVAGGLELAAWADLRVMAEDAVVGVYCRRWGVPLIDGGTVRLQRLIGRSRAMDLILTGRSVAADEALAIGLVNRVVPPGAAEPAAVALAHELAALPQECLRVDRASVLALDGATESEALAAEVSKAADLLTSGLVRSGAARFSRGG